jgi:phosphoglycerate kinase
MKAIKTVDQVDLSGKRVFLRVDFNVPLDENRNVADDTRIVAALPTIHHLMKQGAKIIIGSHLGRPKGTKNTEYSLRPVAAVLAKLLGQPVIFIDDCRGPAVEQAVNTMREGNVLLLENLRFHPGEESNDPAFSKELANFADAYVNDAFATAHRAHASTVGVPHLLPIRLAGFLMHKELTFLGEETANPERPFVVILGGSKVSDKIKIIETLLDRADIMLIGGAMAYTFALALGKKIGSSLAEPDKISIAVQAIEKAKAKGVKLCLPIDNLITDHLEFKTNVVGALKLNEGDIADGWEGVDIGPKTVATFSQEIKKAKTILWNGPMGVFEIPACAKGTFAIAEAVATSKALSIIGGGDSVKAIKDSGYSDRATFISTGGGASLEFLEGKVLPGVAVLQV